MSVLLYFVVPCYNDADTLTTSAPVFISKLNQLVSDGLILPESKILFIDDGSSDATFNSICGLCDSNRCVKGIKLDSNYGEQNAILAGSEYAYNHGADAVISIDCDLQEDISVSDEMIKQCINGSDAVLGVRCARNDDPKSEQFFSSAFYLVNNAFKTGLVKEHSNYRLMNRKAMEELLKHKGETYFLPAMVSNLNCIKTVVYFQRKKRAAGESSYNFLSKFRLAALSVFCHSKYKAVEKIADITDLKNKLNFKAEYGIESVYGE